MFDNSEEREKDLRSRGLNDFADIMKANREGYAGIQKGTGTIVDRRKVHDAIPVPANPMMNIPEPKPVFYCAKCETTSGSTKCENPECFNQSLLIPDNCLGSVKYYCQDDRMIKIMYFVRLLVPVIGKEGLEVVHLGNVMQPEELNEDKSRKFAHTVLEGKLKSAYRNGVIHYLKEPNNPVVIDKSREIIIQHPTEEKIKEVTDKLNSKTGIWYERVWKDKEEMA